MYDYRHVVGGSTWVDWAAQYDAGGITELLAGTLLSHALVLLFSGYAWIVKSCRLCTGWSVGPRPSATGSASAAATNDTSVITASPSCV